MKTSRMVKMSAIEVICRLISSLIARFLIKLFRAFISKSSQQHCRQRLTDRVHGEDHLFVLDHVFRDQSSAVDLRPLGFDLSELLREIFKRDGLFAVRLSA